MHQRTASILRHVITEYIRRAKPVGSEYLVRHRHLPFSSATIRSILHELEEEGYVTHPHTSAGRIPTDKGYRYYLNELSPVQLRAKEWDLLKSALRSFTERVENRTAATPKVLSHLTRTLSVTIEPEKGIVYDAGLVEVVEESDSLDTVREISRIRAAVEEASEGLLADMPDKVTVFVGKENPLLEVEHISCIVRPIRLPHGERILLVMVGPKRMSYSRNISFVEHMATILNETTL